MKEEKCFLHKLRRFSFIIKAESDIKITEAISQKTHSNNFSDNAVNNSFEQPRRKGEREKDLILLHIL